MTDEPTERDVEALTEEERESLIRAWQPAGVGEPLIEAVERIAAARAERDRAEGWRKGYIDGHRQACPGSCTHGVMRNPYRATLRDDA